MHADDRSTIIKLWATTGATLVAGLIVTSVCWTFGSFAALSIHDDVIHTHHEVDSTQVPLLQEHDIITTGTTFDEAPALMPSIRPLSKCAALLAFQVSSVAALVLCAFAFSVERMVHSEGDLRHGLWLLASTGVGLIGFLIVLLLALDSALAPCFVGVGMGVSDAVWHGAHVSGHHRGWRMRMWLLSTLVPCVVLTYFVGFSMWVAANFWEGRYSKHGSHFDTYQKIGRNVTAGTLVAAASCMLSPFVLMPNAFVFRAIVPRIAARDMQGGLMRSSSSTIQGAGAHQPADAISVVIDPCTSSSAA